MSCKNIISTHRYPIVDNFLQLHSLKFFRLDTWRLINLLFAHNFKFHTFFFYGQINEENELNRK